MASLTALHSRLMIRTSLNNVRNPWLIISPSVLPFYDDKSETFRVYTIIIPFFFPYPWRRSLGCLMSESSVGFFSIVPLK